MQLSPLSFRANLPQIQSVSATVSRASTPLTASSSDKFTPSAKMRQGNAEESLEQQFARIARDVNHTTIDELTIKETNSPMVVFVQALEQAWETTHIAQVYRDLMGEGDERF